MGQLATPQAVVSQPLLWLADDDDWLDRHVGFRGSFILEQPASVQVLALGASWYRLLLDGGFVGEGPARFPASHPEYSTFSACLGTGRHVLAAHLHSIGTATQAQPHLAPFWAAAVRAEGEEVPVTWRCAPLATHSRSGRRINPILGWVEWSDTRKLADWTTPDFDDSNWVVPVDSVQQLGALSPLSTAEVTYKTHGLVAQDAGTFVEVAGFHELDDPPARFFLRDFDHDDLPADGVWRRYDLGRVRLGTPQVTLDLPEGAVVEFGGAEFLTRRRVAPYYPGSTGPSAVLDHFVARGGRQQFWPLLPKGMRYLEVHVLAAPHQVAFYTEEFIERVYFGEPTGSFSCDDDLLDRIWTVSVDTLRACAEDAITDCPTRERGQWLGDFATVGLEVAAVAYDDLHLVRRGLQQCAWCASEAGIVAGLSPGNTLHLSTYALQWVGACLRYAQVTGDLALLSEMLPAAVSNVQAFRPWLGPDGVRGDKLWTFVDWGYAPRPAGDVALTLHYLAAARDLARWAGVLDEHEVEAQMHLLAEEVEAIATKLVAANPDGVGYHATVLALDLGLFPADQVASAVEAIKSHMLRCFPNDREAPRLDSPHRQDERVITPYFGHYALAALLDVGEVEFVLDQYRACWGWMLEQGATTWYEVFDHRWSRCHAWSGAPAWQLSQYVLGLQPDLLPPDPGYVLRIRPGPLKRASGVVPLSGGGTAAVQWQRRGDGADVELTTSHPLRVHLPDGVVDVTSKWQGRIDVG